ncbi:hypothetical protein [Aliamphritea spongicola]|nr:hypothetical protein [Aliamphritea spongicola]
MSDSQSFAGYRGNKPVNVVLTGFSVLLASAFSLSVAASAPANSVQMPPDFSQPQAGEHLPGGSASTSKKPAVICLCSLRAIWLLIKTRFQTGQRYLP